MFSEAYRRYALAVFTAVYMLNLVDRGLIALLLQPIKEDLHLTDTQLGTLTGIAFALFYAGLGVPIARWADRGNRVDVTSLAIFLWGATVMACVFVGSYVQLLVARILAGVGEAGCKPPTYSLVGSYFPAPRERIRAMAVYWLGSPLASLISFILGGWLSELYGWRMTFFLMGIPGLILALLVKLTAVEPRTRDAGEHPAAPVPVGIFAVLNILWRRRALRNLSIALVLLYAMGLGMAPWYAAFMVRSHGMHTAQLGVWLGLTFCVGGLAGTLLGGHVAARLFADREDRQMRMSAVMVASLLPVFALFLTVPGKYQALTALVPLTFVLNFSLAPTYALLQRLVSDEMRATTLAVVMLLANLLGMGIAAQLVGILSDLLAELTGTDSLRYAMLVMALLAPWAAYHYWRVGSTVQNEVQLPAHQ